MIIFMSLYEDFPDVIRLFHFEPQNWRIAYITVLHLEWCCFQLWWFSKQNYDCQKTINRHSNVFSSTKDTNSNMVDVTCWTSHYSSYSPRFRLNQLQWRHNGRGSVSNHQPHDYLLNRLFRRRSKKTSKLRVTGLCVGNSLVTGEFPAQMASNAENVSIWWRHHPHVALCARSRVTHIWPFLRFPLPEKNSVFSRDIYVYNAAPGLTPIAAYIRILLSNIISSINQPCFTAMLVRVSPSSNNISVRFPGIMPSGCSAAQCLPYRTWSLKYRFNIFILLISMWSCCQWYESGCFI